MPCSLQNALASSLRFSIFGNLVKLDCPSMKMKIGLSDSGMTGDVAVIKKSQMSAVVFLLLRAQKVRTRYMASKLFRGTLVLAPTQLDLAELADKLQAKLNNARALKRGRQHLDTFNVEANHLQLTEFLQQHLQPRPLN